MENVTPLAQSLQAPYYGGMWQTAGTAVTPAVWMSNASSASSYSSASSLLGKT